MRRKSTTASMMKSYIVDSLLILLNSRAFSDITIKEIAERAGVNRSTYYRHFSCKEEIVFYFLDNLLQDYRGELKEEQVSLERYLKNMFCHFLKYKKELLLLHKNGLSFILLDVLNEQFGSALHKVSLVSEKYKRSYHIGGVFNHLLLWFSRDMADPPELLAKSASVFPDGFVPYLLRNGGV